MKKVQCAECGNYWQEDELIPREDDGQPVCPDCSGLLDDEDLSCQYDESG